MDETEAVEPSQPASAPAWLNPSVVQLAAETVPADAPSAEPAPSPVPPPTATLPPEQSPKWYQRHHKIVAAAAAGTAALLCLVGGSAVYLHSHSLVAVRIANLEPTYAVNDPGLATDLAKAVNSYTLSLQTPDGKRTSYTLADMGMTPDIPATLAAARGQHGIAIWHTAQIPLVIHTNQATYIAFLRAHTVQATVVATDANITVTDGKVSVSAESAGRGYRVSDAPASVLAAAANLNPKPLVLTAGAITPYIRASALQPDRTLLDKVLAQHIDITIGGDDIKPSAADIASWLVLTPNYAKGTIDIAVNKEAVQQYVADITNTYVKSPADTVTPAGGDGAVTIVEQRGGGTVSDESTLIANLGDRLLSGQGQKLAVSISGNVTRTVTAYAQPKWLLVNLTTHRMYAYENTTLVRTFLISAGAYATPTVQGTYKIYAKYASQDMRGENADGSNYFQPNVQYVNYFYKDYAVHGNYWRPLSYFGNINSSHGCVGIVNSDARWVYNWAPIGTTVMVHA